MRISAYFLLIVLTSAACKSFSSKQEEALARVYNTYLYREDLSSIFPPHISYADSVKMAQGYIDKWIRNQLFLRLAEGNLPAEDKNVERQIAGFRASLLIHKYQQYLIEQNLDTIIPSYEINEYFENNGNNFILDNPAISGIYIKVPLSAPNRDRMITWFRNSDFMQIENYTGQHAESFLWFDDQWVYLHDIFLNIPQGSFNPPANLSGLDHIMVTDSEYQYFIGITDYLAPRSQMPISMATQKIKSIILNKRKIKFLNELEKSVLTEGSSKNSYQYF
jgi:hypothetical protein